MLSRSQLSFQGAQISSSQLRIKIALGIRSGNARDERRFFGVEIILIMFALFSRKSYCLVSEIIPFILIRAVGKASLVCCVIKPPSYLPFNTKTEPWE